VHAIRNAQRVFRHVTLLMDFEREPINYTAARVLLSALLRQYGLLAMQSHM